MKVHQMPSPADRKKRRDKEPKICILPDLNFKWHEEEIEKFIFLYNQGCSMEFIAKKLRPYLQAEDAVDEVMILAVHLSREKRISHFKFVIR